MEFTRLLQEAADGRDGAMDQVVELAYADLERVAGKHMRREFGRDLPGVTLEPAALVNETFLRLVRQEKPFTNRRHFFAIATKVLIRVLVDYQRKRGAARRGGGQVRLTLTGVADTPRQDPVTQAEELAFALERLEALDGRKAEVVKLRVFWGMEMSEIASTLGVSVPTITRDWRFARTWLAAELDGST